jgi:hypothetical protein
VNLKSMAVNGQRVPIDSSVFKPSAEKFTFVDTGTTLVYLADGAYEPFVNAVSIHPSFFPVTCNLHVFAFSPRPLLVSVTL